MTDSRPPLAHRAVDTDSVFSWPGFSHAVMAGDHIYVSGVMGTRGPTIELADGVAAQTRQAMANVALVLEACSVSLGELVKVTIFLADLSGFLEMDQAYREVAPNPPPARVTVECSALSLGAAVEIDAIAVRA